MEIKDIINIAAIVLSPIIAVLVTIFLQNRSDKKKEKIAIIKSLLSTGHYLYSDEIIRSYNLIDIVFKDDKDVRAKWKLYYEALCNESLQYQVRLDKKLDLILAMCKSVNYKNITAQDLQRVYVPKGFAEDGEKQRKYTDMQYQGMELLMQIARALNASGLRKIIEEKMTGMALSQVNITQENMRYFLIPVPPFNEQNRIVLKINEVMELCDLLEHEICNAKNYALQLMESVLQEAFSIQETTKPAQVIEFHPDQTTPETELLAAARGKIREDTWEHLCKRALEIAGEES